MRAAEAPISFCMAVCSRRRPLLLAQAIESLLALEIPENITFSILVVENDDTPQYQSLIEDSKLRADITYVVEPVAGLTYARNRVLASARALGPDWLGWIDDDMVLGQDWLIHMVKAIGAYPDTDFFYGNWLRTQNPDTPDWYPQAAPLNTAPTGSKIKVTSGGNIALAAKVFAQDGMALEYDHKFRFCGHEDIDFALQYRAKGGILRSVFEARGTEEIHAGRSSFKQRMIRFSDGQYAGAKLRHKHQSPAAALLLSLQTIYRSTVFGVGNIIIGFLALPFSKHWGLKRYGIGRAFMASAHGVLRYYFGKNSEPYRDVVGH